MDLNGKGSAISRRRQMAPAGSPAARKESRVGAAVSSSCATAGASMLKRPIAVRNFDLNCLSRRRSKPPIQSKHGEHPSLPLISHSTLRELEFERPKLLDAARRLFAGL